MPRYSCDKFCSVCQAFPKEKTMTFAVTSLFSNWRNEKLNESVHVTFDILRIREHPLVHSSWSCSIHFEELESLANHKTRTSTCGVPISRKALATVSFWNSEPKRSSRLMLGRNVGQIARIGFAVLRAKKVCRKVQPRCCGHWRNDGGLRLNVGILNQRS